MVKFIEVKLQHSWYRDNPEYAWMYDWEARSLEFKNGVALAHAVVEYDNDGEKDYVGCYGLINENFEEVYATEKKGSDARYLAFLGFNKNAERFSDNDYLIEVIRRAKSIFAPEYTEHQHVRVVDGVPTLMNVLSSSKPIKTKKEDLFIVKTVNGWALYDIYEGKFITPDLISIREIEESDGLFDLELKVTLEESENKHGLVDYLFCGIDSTGKIVSRVLSSLENGYLDVSPDESIEDLAENRRQYIQEREAQFGEELSGFKKSIDTIAVGSTGHVIKMVDPNKINN